MLCRDAKGEQEVAFGPAEKSCTVCLVGNGEAGGVCLETLEVKLDQSQDWEGFSDEKALNLAYFLLCSKIYKSAF